MSTRGSRKFPAEEIATRLLFIPDVAGVRIVAVDPRIFGEHDSAIWTYLINLFSLHLINAPSLGSSSLATNVG